VKRKGKRVSQKRRRKKPAAVRDRSITAKSGGGVRKPDPNNGRRLIVDKLGQAKTLIYAMNGRTYAHDFSKATLYVTAGRRELIIAGNVRVDWSTRQIRG
jgi:hypothetical protein